MSKRNAPEPFTSLSLIPPEYQERGPARERLIATLQKILNEPGAQKAFDLLAEKGCHRGFLECWLTEPVQADSPIEDAEMRKTQLNTYKSFLRGLEKARKLIPEFYRLTGEPMAHLYEALQIAIRRVEPWAKLPRPRLLFTRRQYQQFRLLERIRHSTGRWRVRQAATLISALYTVNKIPGKHPTEESLAHLVKRFKTNSARHLKARLEASKTQ